MVPPPPLTVTVVLGRLLPVAIEACAFLQLRILGAHPTFRHLGYQDAEVGSPHRFDGDPNKNIAACHGVGLPPLDGKAAGNTFQCVLCLVTYQAIN